MSSSAAFPTAGMSVIGEERNERSPEFCQRIARFFLTNKKRAQNGVNFLRVSGYFVNFEKPILKDYT